MEKKLLIGMKLDTSGFDRAISELQNKLNKVYGPSHVINAQNQTASRLSANGMPTSGPGQAAFAQATQNHKRELQQLIQAEKAAMGDVLIEMAKKDAKLKELIQSQKALVQGSSDELKIREQIARVEENQGRLRQSYMQKDAGLNALLDAKEKQGNNAPNIDGQGILKAAGALAGVLKFAAEADKQVSQSKFRTNVNNADAIQGTVGRVLQDNQSAYGQAWGPERIKAMKAAEEMGIINRRDDKIRLAAGGVGLAGAGIGAMTGVGALPAIGVAGASAYGLFGNERMRALSSSTILNSASDQIHNSAIGRATGNMFGAGDWLKKKASEQQKEYNSIDAKEFASNYASQLDAEQKQNPFKNLAAQDYNQNYQSYLSAQRGAGLDSNSFHGKGGFLSQVTGAGFMNSQGTQMIDSILGAGGSSRSAAGNSVLGLQLQRNKNLTNSGSILGTLSGSLGSSESTKDATIKILAEGMKLGLDNSKFSEENRRFTQAAAEVVARSGARTESDVADRAGEFGKFVAEKSNAGISAAQSAYDRYQEHSGQTSGPVGIMKASGLRSNSGIASTGTKNLTALLLMKEQDMKEDSLVVQNTANLATENGYPMTAKEVVKYLKENVKNSETRYADTDQHKQKVQTIMKKYGLTTMPSDTSAYPGLAAAHAQFASDYSAENGVTNDKDIRASIQKMTDMSENASTGGIETGLANTKTGKDEDRTVANLAENSKLVNDNFLKFKDTLVPAAESLASLNKYLEEMVKKIEKLPPLERDAAFAKMNGAARPSEQKNSK